MANVPFANVCSLPSARSSLPSFTSKGRHLTCSHRPTWSLRSPALVLHAPGVDSLLDTVLGSLTSQQMKLNTVKTEIIYSVMQHDLDLIDLYV